MAINPNTTFVAGNILTAAQQNRLPFGVCASSSSTTDYTLTTTLTIATGMSATFTAIANRLYRVTYYEPAVELKRLVGGFIREQIRPHLESGQSKIHRLAESARAEDDPEQRKFLEERMERLEQWMRSGGRVLPILQKLLGQ